MNKSKDVHANNDGDDDDAVKAKKEIIAKYWRWPERLGHSSTHHRYWIVFFAFFFLSQVTLRLCAFIGFTLLFLPLERKEMAMNNLIVNWLCYTITSLISSRSSLHLRVFPSTFFSFSFRFRFSILRYFAILLVRFAICNVCFDTLFDGAQAYTQTITEIQSRNVPILDSSWVADFSAFSHFIELPRNLHSSRRNYKYIFVFTDSNYTKSTPMSSLMQFLLFSNSSFSRLNFAYSSNPIDETNELNRQTADAEQKNDENGFDSSMLKWCASKCRNY